ncbi:MAG: hypothetical protein NWQ23_02445, partial [Yoonia sp.]|uniref:hypothetical protein n=1 Tax=Yoonia sp. TaxID=2212373 RepID=UPI00273E5F02
LDASERYVESSALKSDDDMIADEDDLEDTLELDDALENDAEDLVAADDSLEDDDFAEDTLEDALAEAEDTDEDEDEDEVNDTAELDEEDDVSASSLDDDEFEEDDAAALDDEDEAEDDTVSELADEFEDFDEDEASDEDEPVEDIEETTAEPAEPDRSTLVLTYRDVASRVDDPSDDDDDDDDDFNLREEVAKVEAEIAARQGNAVARHGLPRSVDDAMSRIMSQTDQHLNKPESRRHRDAFAQLKAAVAATEAARQLGDEGEKAPDPDEVFKDDLGAHDAEEKSQAQASAPLKLVKSEPTEQPVAQDNPSVDATETEPAAVVNTPVAEQETTKAAASATPLDAASARLRSIADLKEADGTAGNGGFAEFAAAQDATELADMLEAAGAYLCFVEGEQDFSRPQVMKVVQSATTEEITREDGLRYFGRLLRQGKLIKLSNGRFRVSGNSQFRPDDDQAAQG